MQSSVKISSIALNSSKFTVPYICDAHRKDVVRSISYVLFWVKYRGRGHLMAENVRRRYVL